MSAVGRERTTQTLWRLVNLTNIKLLTCLADTTEYRSRLHLLE